jgi:hypothetical protein
VKIDTIEPAREFEVLGVQIKHTANIELEPDEQVTFVTASGTEFDVARKSWGYYGTPSLNGRLADHGLRAVLVRGERSGKMFVLFVERGKEADFEEYIEWDRLRIVTWLDTHDATDELARKLGLLPG